jgi:hypothetical protein
MAVPAKYLLYFQQAVTALQESDNEHYGKN